MVKAVEPSPLLREAAETLGPVCDDVVVIGAVALEVALAEKEAALTPTRDVDLVVHNSDVDSVVGQLEAAELRRSTVEHEEAFTWVRGDLKVQLIRGFYPFPAGASARLPVNPVVEAARDDVHRERVAFATAPCEPRLWVANPACLVALKQNAFGRTRASDDAVVRRDFHDVYELFRHVPEDVLRSYELAQAQVRQRVRAAARLLCDDGCEPVRLAAEEMVELEEADSLRDAEQEVLLTAEAFMERLE